jgi:hypothetical protein
LDELIQLSEAINDLQPVSHEKKEHLIGRSFCLWTGTVLHLFWWLIVDSEVLSLSANKNHTATAIEALQNVTATITRNTVEVKHGLVKGFLLHMISLSVKTVCRKPRKQGGLIGIVRLRSVCSELLTLAGRFTNL